MLALIRRARPSGLDRADCAILAMVARGLERESALRRAFPFGKADGSSPYVVSQRHGAWLQLGDRTVSSAETARRLDEETERLRADAARGIVPPRFVLDPVLKSLRDLRPSDALGRQIEALASLRSNSTDEPGVRRLPGGEDYYRLRLRCTTGLDDRPERIERRVAEETADLLRRADAALRRAGLEQGGVGERLRALKRRPEHLYANDDAGRARAVADMNALLDRRRKQLAFMFNPPLEPGSAVRRMAPADEQAGRRGYRDAPTAAGPGAYYPDLGQVHERPSWTLAPVVFHETVPGHLLQLGRQRPADPHPLQLRYAPGYSEGWAVYAETLVGDIGWPPEVELGFLQSRLFRLARVACDIGLHLRRWERARAIRYLEETVGFELFFPFAAEVDRYAVEPAGFAGDAMVALTLQRLGRRAAASRRARGFHDAVLDHGPLSAEAIERIA